MSKARIKLPFDVLSYWYQAAKDAIEHYNPDTSYSPPNEELSKKKKRGYEMAVKTVEALKDIVETVEIIESEETNNE